MLYLITFEYRDDFTHERWIRESGVFRTVQECINFYGLGKGCDYRIISVEEWKEN